MLYGLVSCFYEELKEENDGGPVILQRNMFSSLILFYAVLGHSLAFLMGSTLPKIRSPGLVVFAAQVSSRLG